MVPAAPPSKTPMIASAGLNRSSVCLTCVRRGGSRRGCFGISVRKIRFHDQEESLRALARLDFNRLFRRSEAGSGGLNRIASRRKVREVGLTLHFGVLPQNFRALSGDHPQTSLAAEGRVVLGSDRNSQCGASSRNSRSDPGTTRGGGLSDREDSSVRPVRARRIWTWGL